MATDSDALNYPYIRIRDVEWLKRTLLLFPHVVRMTPRFDAPADGPAVFEFCELQGRRGPLLQSARLWEPHVEEAQRNLILRLKGLLSARDSRFRDQFGKKAAALLEDDELAPALTVWEKRLGNNRMTFQIHREKLLQDLAKYLLDEKLAWIPNFPDGDHYVEMHRHLGEAVMATVAVACAENQGLELLTEFPEIHGRVLGEPSDRIFEACLNKPKMPMWDRAREATQLFVYMRCNPAKLAAERILALKQEHEALSDFKDTVRAAAESLPDTILDERTRLQRLNAIANDIFEKWQKDKANLTGFARAVFGEDLLGEPTKLMQTLAEKSFGPTAAGAYLGEVNNNVVEGAVAGLAIGIVTHGVAKWCEVKRRERNSPLRYLTLMEKRGVAFTTD
jgi:hypothetical protein